MAVETQRRAPDMGFTENPDDLFLITETGASRYGDLQNAINRTHILLQEAGVARGDLVFLYGDYSLPVIATLFALQGMGAVVAPCEERMPEEESARRRDTLPFTWVIKPADATAPDPVTIERQSPASAKISEDSPLQRLRSSGHAGLILFSSGSTGTPKAILHDFDNLLQSYPTRRARPVRILLFLLFDHIGGLNTLFHGVRTGATLVAPSARDPETVASMLETHRVRVFPTTPSFLNLFLLSGVWRDRDWSQLRLITYGTEPMPESLLPRLREAFPQVRFVQAFGASETGIARTVTKSSQSTLLRFEDPNLETRVVDGELWLRGSTQALGYLNVAESSFTEDGWFRTGDQVEVTEDGYLRILGTERAIINVGGRKAHPLEVESVLLRLPEVAACRVDGVPHPLTGHVIRARVVPPPGQDFSPADLRARIRKHCRQHLESHKVPVRVEFVDSLSTTPRGKAARL